MSNFIIRPFRSSDTLACIKLFEETVLAVGPRYYSEEQVIVWASNTNYKHWKEKLEKATTFVAEIDAKIVGFADLTVEGILDHMYVHKNYQGYGISYALYKKIEEIAKKLNMSKIIIHAGIMAMFLAKRIGFKIVKCETVVRNNTKFTRYVMEKDIC